MAAPCSAGDLIAKLDTAGKAAAAPAKQAPAPAAPVPASTAPPKGTGAKSDIAMPAAAKMLADAAMSASQVAGTGRDGRITKGDVIGAVEAKAKPASAPSPAAAPAPAARPALPEVKAPIDIAELVNRPEQRVPMSRLRQRVAERLVQSQSTAAILTTFNEVNMQPLLELRNRYKEKFEKEHGVKLGFMSFFVKACGDGVEAISDR